MSLLIEKLIESLKEDSLFSRYHYKQIKANYLSFKYGFVENYEKPGKMYLMLANIYEWYSN